MRAASMRATSGPSALYCQSANTTTSGLAAITFSMEKVWSCTFPTSGTLANCGLLATYMAQVAGRDLTNQPRDMPARRS